MPAFWKGTRVKSILPGNMDRYLNGLLPARDAVPAEMEAYAEQQSFPIIGPQAGQFLMWTARLHQPRRVFEMGSGFGYSMYWILRGAPQAVAIGTERSADNIQRAVDGLGRAGLAGRVTFHQGDAFDILRASEGPYDMIFNDVDKDRYPEAFHLAMSRLRPGGLLMTDNVLWSGKVAGADEGDRHTQGVREYNRLMFEADGVTSTIVPIRDGIGVSIKDVQ